MYGGTPRAAVPSGYTPFRFQGAWFDAKTSLNWVITRWYAQSLGRFISEDTLLGTPSEPPSRHLYAYAAGEPIGRWDPDGRFWYKVKTGESYGTLAYRFLGRNTASLRGLIKRKNFMQSAPTAGQCIWIPKRSATSAEASYRLATTCRAIARHDLNRPDRPNVPDRGGYLAGACVSFAVGVGGYTTGSLCLVKDDTGRRAIIATLGGGGMAGYVMCCGSVGVQISNGRISEMPGLFGTTGALITTAKGTFAADISYGKDFETVVSTSAMASK